jgi:hypothetical protein
LVANKLQNFLPPQVVKAQTPYALVSREEKFAPIVTSEKIGTVQQHHDMPILRLRFFVDILDLMIGQPSGIINDEKQRPRHSRLTIARSLACSKGAAANMQ